MRVKIQFSEAQKAVTSQTSIEGEVVTPQEQQEMLDKAKEIFDDAMKYAKFKSMEKMR